MPLARIITVEPEAARDLAAHLCLQGFEVEAARPGVASSYAADREIDLAHCAPEEAAVCIGNILREPIAGCAAEELGTPRIANQEYCASSRVSQEAAAPELMEGEEELSSWPIWNPLRQTHAANPSHAMPTQAKSQAPSRTIWRLRAEVRSALAALGVAAVILAAFLLHRHTARADPIVHNISQAAGRVSSQSAPLPPVSPGVLPQLATRHPKIPHPRHREERRSRADKLIAADTVVRFDRRKGSAGDRQHRAAHSRSGTSAANVVAADTVIRHNTP